MAELLDDLSDLAAQLERFADQLDLAGKRRELTDLEARMSEPGFWDDQDTAKASIARVKALKGVLDPHAELSAGVAACRELAELAVGDDQALAEVAGERDALRQGLAALELKLALSGPYDANSVFLTIKPGAGGTDACDWAEMLYRMYANYCKDAGYTVTLIDHEPGTTAGLKTVTLGISGENAYGYLKSEMGTHRLVRLSPFNAGSRETSFAAVELTPELPEQGEVTQEDLDPKEFRIDTYRAGGAGGQHVNKTDSAVRITHIPTGIVASCQLERSQVENKNKCWKMMVAKLQQQRESARLRELQDLGAERGTIGWGHQIRSYVLHPYQMVKDLRTGHETSQTQSVLAGDLQPFIDAYLRWRLAGCPPRNAVKDN